MTADKTAVVAGHICLDVIPDLSRFQAGQFFELFQPGHLIQVGAVQLTTGGAVSNTGQALHILGIPTHLIAKVGSDAFGEFVRQSIGARDPRLAEGIATDRSSSTSYSIIISPPGMDRIFLHSPGANDTFTSQDIDFNAVAQADLFHFGYPPMMQAMYQDQGAELVKAFRQAKAVGATTSLDMAFPDPSGASGQVNWTEILSRCLPLVDVFLPSIDEILWMTRRELYEDMMRSGGVLTALTPALLGDLSSALLAMGAKIVGLKLGERGFYLRTSANLQGLGRAAPTHLDQWQAQSLWEPCFKVNVAGTTGSGDATIAGFLAGLLHDLSPQAAATMAVAVGACNVEAADAVSGIRSWEETVRRIKTGWERHTL